MMALRNLAQTLTDRLRVSPVRHPIIAVRDRVADVLRRGTSIVRLAVERRRSVATDPTICYVMVPHGGRAQRPVPSRLRTDHRSSATIAANRELVRRMLDRTGISYSEHGRSFVVEPHDRHGVSAMLADAPPSVFVVCDGGLPQHARGDERIGERFRDLIVFEYTSAETGSATYGPECGWHVIVSDAAAAAPTSGETAPIDVVYTWVDGSSAAWQAERDAALGRSSRATVHSDGTSAARYRTYDELRYSLRSVERYAEFVRHVYLVTDDQVPAWLDTSAGGLTVVDHRDIFPDPSVLPTFNSHAIEACLHRIPALAEHYLYLNDDFLFLRRAEPIDFFDDEGRARCFVSSALIPTDTTSSELKSVDLAGMNVKSAVEREFGEPVTTNKFRHAPYAQRRAVHAEIERRFPAELARTRAARFRSAQDVAVASALHQHVALIIGLGVPGEIPSGYVDLGGPHVRERLRRVVHDRSALTLCLNDSEGRGSQARRHRTVRRFLDSILPGPSRWESSADG